MVTISDCTRRGYWLVAITCKDRNKLLFDTVCTLADLDYDVYHATVDSNKGIASQEYYIKPRYGSIGGAHAVWNTAHTSRVPNAPCMQRPLPRLDTDVHCMDGPSCVMALACKPHSLPVTLAVLGA